MKDQLKRKANPYLSWFVMCCSVTIVVLLYTMDRTERIKEELLIRGDYTAYLEY